MDCGFLGLKANFVCIFVFPLSAVFLELRLAHTLPMLRKHSWWFLGEFGPGQGFELGQLLARPHARPHLAAVLSPGPDFLVLLKSVYGGCVGSSLYRSSGSDSHVSQSRTDTPCPAQSATPSMGLTAVLYLSLPWTPRTLVCLVC